MEGLTSKKAEALLKEFGPNEITEKKESFISKIAKRATSPISLMLLAAAILSLITGKVFDFYLIIFLYLLNKSTKGQHMEKYKL